MNPLLTTGLDPHRGMTALSVNLNKVALLRNTRALGIPSVTRAAAIALEAGAQGITIHPRPDERHIRASDVHELAALMKGWPQAEFNIEGNPLHNLMDFVRAVRPHQCTFVPDAADQATSDHGWSFPHDAQRLKPLVDEAKALGVRVSLFMDPTPEALRSPEHDLRRRHRHLRHPPHRRDAAAARRALRREGAGPHRVEGLSRSPRQGRGTRHRAPRHAFFGQGSLLQGHRPGHAHADD